MAARDRMQREELLNDLWLGEPITVTLRNGVVVKGAVFSRNRRNVPSTTILESEGVAVSIPDTDVERVVLEDAEWRRSGS